MQDRYMMDGHKLFWHLDRVNHWLKGERISPLHIDFGITTGCNEDCIYCYGVLQGRTTGAKRFDMPKKYILRFLKDAKDVGIRSIAFIGEGENTLNNALYDALSCAKTISLDVGLATNGLKIDKYRFKGMMSSLVWIRFNISAATPNSYFKIHRVKGIDQVVNNIKSCVNTKKKLGLKTTIGLQMVLVRENIDDIVPLAKLGRELGVDYLVIKPCSDNPRKDLNAPTRAYLDVENLLKEAETYSTEDYNVVIKWRKVTNLGIKTFKICYGTHFIINISGNGDVFPCGYFFNSRRNKFKMGNIIKTPFAEIVKSQRYWDVQKRIENVNVNKECETNCRQYYVSQFLWELKNPPPHVNFV